MIKVLSLSAQKTNENSLHLNIESKKVLLNQDQIELEDFDSKTCKLQSFFPLDPTNIRQDSNIRWESNGPSSGT